MDLQDCSLPGCRKFAITMNACAEIRFGQMGLCEEHAKDPKIKAEYIRRTRPFQPGKTILALDLGTQTGWAMLDLGKISSGTLNFKATRFQSADRRFVNFETWLYETLNKTILATINTVYFEEVRRHKGVDAAHCYGGFKAILTTFCQKNGISFQGVPVGTIKKSISGKGNADKQEVIQAVRALGHNPKDDNEADAIALLYTALNGEKNNL